MCGDKRKPVNLTVSEIVKHYEKMSKHSSFADIWMLIMVQCNGWDIYKPHANPKVEPWASEKQIETAFPVLFLSNALDPVTPLRAAVKMALKFKDAGLVEQNASGHSTLSAISRCTAKVVRDYIRHGKVPPPPDVDGSDYLGGKWTICEADREPFGTGVVEMSEDDRELVEAWETLGDVIVEAGEWGLERRLHTKKLRGMGSMR